MGRLKKRLERLEQEHGPSRREPSEEERKRRWLAEARGRLIHSRGRRHVRSTINALRRQGRLGATAEDLRERLLAWRPPLDRPTIEREIARTIHDREEGTENMACPPGWRESFAAADELGEKYAAVPDETLARWAVMQHELDEGGPIEGVDEEINAEAETYGITEELILRAVGPDARELTDEELSRRLTTEILADTYYGEQAYRIQKHIDRLMPERGEDR